MKFLWTVELGEGQYWPVKCKIDRARPVNLPINKEIEETNDLTGRAIGKLQWRGECCGIQQCWLELRQPVTHLGPASQIGFLSFPIKKCTLKFISPIYNAFLTAGKLVIQNKIFVNLLKLSPCNTTQKRKAYLRGRYNRIGLIGYHQCASLCCNAQQ